MINSKLWTLSIQEYRYTSFLFIAIICGMTTP